jgi:hypothetical protein
MKILLITSEVWNDVEFGNNNMTNWFQGMKDVEIAHIFCSAGRPSNRCCKRYFRISDKAIFNSLFFRSKPAGETLYFDDYPTVLQDGHKSQKKFRSPVFRNSIVRLLRDIAWNMGRVNKTEIRKFICDFEPDVIFTQRMASIRTCSVERLINELFKDIPFVAYTGDDEYSLKQLSFDPLYWIRRIMIRNYLKKNVKFYKQYYTMSEKQAEDYKRIFGVNTKLLYKCGQFSPERIHKDVNSPIRLVYIGKLYCNRWKILREIKNILSSINITDVKIILSIYSGDKVSKKQYKQLHDGVNSCFMGYISPKEIHKIHSNSDIVLHVESFDLKNRLLTKHSFSTKIIDCLASGCAVMAVCWKEHSGYKYLDKEDAAITVCNKKELQTDLLKIACNPDIITQYALKAYNCGTANHQADDVHEILKSDFKKIVCKNKK